MSLALQRQKEHLIRLATKEMEGRPGWALPVHLDLLTLTCVVGALQLSLRHPENNGPSSAIIRDVVSQIIERVRADGFEASAATMALGNNPEWDE